jgi:hypothetical protein
MIDEHGSNTYTLGGGEYIEPDYWEGLSLSDLPHGPKLYCADAPSEDGFVYTLGQKNQNLFITGVPASTSMTVSISILIGDDVDDYSFTSSSSGTGNWTAAFSSFADSGGANPPAFFHWGGLWLTQQITTGTVSIVDGDGPLLRQVALADWEDVEEVFEMLRFNSFNLMFSNTAAVLDKDGFTAGWQCPKNVDWLTVLMNGFHAVANKPQSTRMEVKNGIHGFFKSTAPSDWNYLKVGDSKDGSANASRYKLYAESDTLIICNKIPKADGRAGYWTIFSCTEERHDSVWHNEGYPNHTRQQFERALEIQARVPQWHENPFHIKDIFNFIKGNKDKIKRTAGVINGITGNRGGQVIDPLMALLDTWF